MILPDLFNRVYGRLRTRKVYLDLGIIGLLTWLVWFACTGTNLAVSPQPDNIEAPLKTVESPATPIPTKQTVTPTPTAEVDGTIDSREYANVTRVTANGSPGSYRFSVTIESPDTGCDQYADWWEVLSLGGELLNRRVLIHSHVNEQPFTRSGSSIDLNLNEEVIVRAHMNTSGYGGTAMRGSPEGGFQRIELPQDFARNVGALEPLPTDCAF